VWSGDESLAQSPEALDPAHPGNDALCCRRDVSLQMIVFEILGTLPTCQSAKSMRGYQHNF
jgi:hypothetical protein